MARTETYAEWLATVDRMVQRKLRVSISDLPDYPYREDYDRGRSPANTVDRVLWANS
ncbi:hypothetical protein J4U01_gp082 [Mycobacterium phage Kumao]|uniref:Uncharacterized protein n=1 Tax=Mycobacterium phage Kumao TaxID=2041344 RepID=A0A2D1GPV0_9CAUD|nr:hypothetical protein J4U01_gp082 [Mycobacterium phage Kumao]ATN94076.1 hypothetical protein SEA_KUMAO_114 [Mycobacterium phage Kumao]